MPEFQATIGPSVSQSVERLVERTKRLAVSLGRAQGDERKASLNAEFQSHCLQLARLMTYLASAVPELKALIDEHAPQTAAVDPEPAPEAA